MRHTSAGRRQQAIAIERRRVCQRQGRERAENTNDPTGIEILDLRCPKNTHNINSPVVCCTRFIAIAPVGPPVSKKSPFPVTVHSIILGLLERKKVSPKKSRFASVDSEISEFFYFCFWKRMDVSTFNY